MLFLVKNFLVKKEVETVRCRDARASSFVAKVRGEVFSHFHAVVCGIDCLAFQDKLFDAKENDEHALDVASHLSRSFGLDEIVLSVYSSCFLP
jgi:hypothetical protein